MTKARVNGTTSNAKGDLVVGTGSTTAAALSVGTDGYAVVADSTQTTGLAYKNIVPSQTSNSGKYLTTDGTNTSWGTISAGSMTQIATGNLAGANPLSITSIPQTYRELKLFVNGWYDAGNVPLLMYVNGDSTNTSYGYTRINSGSNSVQAPYYNTYWTVGSNQNAANNGAMQFTFPNYTSSYFKFAYYSGTYINGDGYGRATTGSLAYHLTTAITSIQLANFNDAWGGGTYTLYGVN